MKTLQPTEDVDTGAGSNTGSISAGGILTGPRNRSAEEIFQQWLDARILGASDVDPADLCRQAPELLPDVLELVDGFQAIDGFLPSPSKPSPFTGPESPEAAEPAPPRVERYAVQGLLGQGGMGEVWLAEQESPVQRPVALKVIKQGRDTRSILHRFDAERQALASMDHPAIAKLFDAGKTSDGLPYFAMERVDGLSIDRYCDQHRLTLQQRLELFVGVCEGVQHAHQKGVIHRDLKPSNVLVTVRDGRPQAKIIDFGIAKATTSDQAGDVTLTELGQLVGTPAYMSPEQVDPGSSDVDTRSDVYSLGVVLYELLVGIRPFGVQPFSPQAARSEKAQETELPTPSSRLSSLGRRASEVAERRQTQPASLARALRGDLDWIVLKALRFDREKRYVSAAALADDIKRHFRDEPVLAGPPAALYLWAKFVRRHRWAVAMSLVVILAVLSALAGLAVGLDRARRAEQQAKQESEVASHVSDFLVGVFKQASPKAENSPMSVRDLLDRGTDRIDSELADQPLVRARLLETMGQAYSGLGFFDTSQDLILRAIDVRNEENSSPLDLAGTFYALANVQRLEGYYDDALKAAERALELRLQGSDPFSLERVESYRQIGSLLSAQGQFEKALGPFNKALTIGEKALGPNHVELGKLVNNIAIVYLETGDLERARQLMERGLDIFEKQLGSEHPHVAATLNNLALVAERSGDLESSAAYHRRGLALREATLETAHPDIAESLNNLGSVLTSLGQFDEAQVLLERALAIREQSLAAAHPWTGTTWANLGRLSLSVGDSKEARRRLQRALDIIEQALGPDHLYMATVLGNLAGVDDQEGLYEAAEQKILQCIQIVEQSLGPDHPQIASHCLALYPELLGKLGREDEAEAIRRRIEELQG